MTITGPKLLRVTSARVFFVGSCTKLRSFRRSAFATAFTAAGCTRAMPGRSGVRYGLRLRRIRRESTGAFSTLTASEATNVRNLTVFTATARPRFANGRAFFARVIALVIFAVASVFGSAVKTRFPSRSLSGVEKYVRISLAASDGRRLPTGMPPMVTPSGSRRGVGIVGVVVVVVVAVEVVPVVVAAVVVTVVLVVVVSASGAGPPANAYAARTPARAHATTKETLKARFMWVLATVFVLLGRRGLFPANPGR